tara:strand:+ start:25 stop:822 length:798 start_codon:yes stop_codon:yes gene_type:complete
MFFWLSKLFWFVFAPLNILALLGLISIILSSLKVTKEVGKKLGIFTLIVFICISFLPIGPNLLVYLEKHAVHLKNEASLEKPEGVLILGGCIEPSMSQVHKTPILGSSCERIFEGIALHKKYPDITIMYLGGSGNPYNQEIKEADLAYDLFKKLGIDTKNFLFENLSRNTFENAKYSKALLKEQPEANSWYLVTSASHMLRASTVFCSMDWQVSAYPVDFRTDLQYKVLPNLRVDNNIGHLHIALKEFIGISAYWITGKISLKKC